jgi:hypothetical protein
MKSKAKTAARIAPAKKSSNKAVSRKPVASRRAINHEVVHFLKMIRGKAVREEIRATQAVDIMLDSFPDISRAECYNSAELAGINKLTARNVFDKRNNG